MMQEKPLQKILQKKWIKIGKMSAQPNDYDSPWKEILELYFRDFMNFFFPAIYNDINWEKGYIFLDKEFQKIVRDSETGKRYADKLVKVWRNNGEEKWVLIHVEIQGQKESEFSKRMFIYNYRIFDKYSRSVVSLAILTDSNHKWRPKTYGYELWGCRVGIEFPIVKLLDYVDKWEYMETSLNPFAVVVMTHLKSQETAKDANKRKTWKFYLIKRLYEKGYSKKDILNLFHFIDWIMLLPENIEEIFLNDLQEYEEEHKVRYITSIEKIGFKKGMQQGMQQGIELAFLIKFGDTEATRMILSKIHKINNLDKLKAVKNALKDAETLNDFVNCLK